MTERKTGTALVIGGGVAGMTAALDLSRKGHRVHIVEREDRLGGLVAQLHLSPPGHVPHGDLIEELRSTIEQEEGITVHTSSLPVSLEGEAPDLSITVRGENGQEEQVTAGAIVVATGAAVFDAGRLPEFKYGRTSSVVTSLQFESLMGEAGEDPPPHPETREPLKNVGFVQCVGSRMETRGNPWCSNYCCMATVKQAHELRRRSPDTRVFVYYMDMRTFDRGQEALYTRSKLEGVRYTRGVPSEILVRGDSGLVVRAEDASLGRVVERELDLLVLAVGLEPPAGTKDLVEMLGLASTEDGFLPVPDQERSPCSTGVKGIFVAGSADFPKRIKDAVTQAKAAALEADTVLTGS